MADYRDEGRSRYGRDRGMHSDNDDNRWRPGGGDRWNEGRREETGWGGGRSGGSDQDRGFLERAGDEMRSWLGNEDAERRRGREGRRSEGGGNDWRGGWADNGYRSNQPGPEHSRYGESGGDWESSQDRETWGGGSDWSGPGGSGGARSQRSGSPWDENYRRWREQQIRELDREYEEYRRERQQHFDNDFASWRQNRQSGQAQSPGQGAAGSFGSDTAGAATAAGGTASAARSSTGSSGTDAAGSSTLGAQGESGSGGGS